MGKPIIERTYPTFEDACRDNDARIAMAQIRALPTAASPMSDPYGVFDCCGESESCADCAKAQREADRYYC